MLANLRSLSCAALIALIVTSSLSAAFGRQAPSASDALLVKPLVTVWRRDSLRILNLSPAGFGDKIYIAVEGGAIIAFEIERGAQLWRTEVGGEISAAPYADDKSVYVATRKSPDTRQAGSTEQGTLRCLTAFAGLTRWASDSAEALTGNIAASDSSLFSLDSNGALVAYDKAHGARLWRLRLESKFATDVVVNGKLLFVCTQDGGIYAIEQATGAVKWRRKTQGAATPSVLSTEGRHVFVGEADGRVQALDAADGKSLWTKRLGGTIGAVLPVTNNAANNLIVTTLNNFVYNLKIERGSRVWKRQTAGRIAAHPVTDGDSVLIASAAGDASVVFRISDGKIVNTISVGADAANIAHTLLTKDALIFTTNAGVISYAASSETAR